MKTRNVRHRQWQRYLEKIDQESKCPPGAIRDHNRWVARRSRKYRAREQHRHLKDAGAFMQIIYDELERAYFEKNPPQMTGILNNPGIVVDPQFQRMKEPTPSRKPCPNDTNGDGDCGKPSCPHCGKYGR